MGIERARLKARGPAQRLVGVKAVYPRAADVPRHDVYALGNGHAARALGPHKGLVAGEAHDVDVHLLHVDGDDASALGGVDDADGAHLVGGLADARHVDDVARDVGGARHHHDLGARRDEPEDVVHVETAELVGLGVFEFDAALLRDAVERAKDGVVLERRRDDAVALVDQAVDSGVEGGG